MPNQLDVDIRWLIRRDMPEVMAIERQCFPEPWTDDDLTTCLRQWNCIGMVCEHVNAIFGFMFYELHKSQIGILNFAVHPDHQRCGVGRQMIDRLKDKLSQQRRTLLLTQVRELNIDAQLFFRAMGFKATELIRGWYEDSDEDCYVLRYSIDTETRMAWSNPYHPRNRISEHIDT